MATDDNAPESQKHTLAELVDLYSSNLGQVIASNGVAVVVCALTVNKFEVSVACNPAFGGSQPGTDDIAQKVGDAVLAILKERYMGGMKSGLILPGSLS